MKKLLEEIKEFDERTQKVLWGIINSYIETTEPVGSRTLSKSLDISLSPATIRNIMADLSELGYLKQTHTSAGRIPTDKAYRFYVDSLSVANALSGGIQEKIRNLSSQGTAQVEQLLINTTRVLAGLTKFVCLVSAPKVEVSRLQRIEFIKISSNQILVILITKSGIIRNKIITPSEDVSQDFLNSVATFLNDQFRDRSLVQIRKHILESMVEDKKQYDHLLALAVRLGKKAFEIEDPPKLYMEGQFNLLLSEQFEQNTVKSLLDAFEHKSVIMDILDHTVEAEGIQIYIGVETQHEEFKDCALITANYGNEHNVLGTLGVIGPTCMNYQRIIPVVDYTAKILTQAISERSYD